MYFFAVDRAFSMVGPGAWFTCMGTFRIKISGPDGDDACCDTFLKLFGCCISGTGFNNAF